MFLKSVTVKLCCKVQWNQGRVKAWPFDDISAAILLQFYQLHMRHTRKTAVPIVLSPEPANSPEPWKTLLWQFLSNITRNNEACVSQEDDHLTHPLKVKPEEPSGAFYPCQSSVHMKLIDPLKWPSYSINDPNKLNVDGVGGPWTWRQKHVPQCVCVCFAF